MRVFSRTRVHCKALLNGIGVDSFDPLQIVGKTKGRMAEDNHLNITRKARIVLRSNALIFQTNLIDSKAMLSKGNQLKWLVG